MITFMAGGPGGNLPVNFRVKGLAGEGRAHYAWPRAALRLPRRSARGESDCRPRCESRGFSGGRLPRKLDVLSNF